MRIFANQTTQAYFRYISIWVMFTCGLNVLHSKFVLDIHLSPATFIFPVLAGVVFGVMNARISLLSGHLNWLAEHDPLTQAYNRGYFSKMLAELTIDKNHDQHPLSLIVLDIDHFKMINDGYGHQAGDAVLVKLSELINQAKRGWDVFARYGGEEFVVLAPKTNITGAAEFAERLRQEISNTQFPEVGQITCSLGVAEHKMGEDKPDEVFRRADEALYRAKEGGRNQVQLENHEH